MVLTFLYSLKIKLNISVTCNTVNNFIKCINKTKLVAESLRTILEENGLLRGMAAAARAA